MAKFDRDLFHSRQHDMITTAHVQDQELSIRAVRCRIDHPAVTGRSYLGSREGRERDALFGAAHAVGGAEFAYPDTARRQRQLALGRNERNCRSEPNWI